MFPKSTRAMADGIEDALDSFVGHQQRKSATEELVNELGKLKTENERLQAQLAEFKDFQYAGWREQIEERNAQLAQVREAANNLASLLQKQVCDQCGNGAGYNKNKDDCSNCEQVRNYVAALSSITSSSAWLAQQRSEAAEKALRDLADDLWRECG